MTAETTHHSDPFSSAVRSIRLSIVALIIAALVSALVLVGLYGIYVHGQAESRRRATELCSYANRITAGARLDRQFLVVLSTRPGLPPDATRDQIIRSYLDFGNLAFPTIDCGKVVAGGAPPPLPPLPPSPLAAVTTTTTTPGGNP